MKNLDEIKQAIMLGILKYSSNYPRYLKNKNKNNDKKDHNNLKDDFYDNFNDLNEAMFYKPRLRFPNSVVGVTTRRSPIRILNRAFSNLNVDNTKKLYNKYVPKNDDSKLGFGSKKLVR